VNTKISPAAVGAFVIGAFALGVVALLTFGGVSIFSKPQRFVVYFNESIHGLDLGSPVKLRGVRVGRVADLNIRYDEKTNRSVVAVLCEFNRDKMTDNKGALIDVTDRAELQTLVDHGLRAQLGVLGLATGLLFVELDFFNPKEFPANDKLTELKYVVVPSVPSAISEFQASATEILANLKKVDFAGLGREVTALAVDARKKIEGVDLAGVEPQKLTDELASGATWLVTMGCGEACPVVPGLLRDDWPLEDPKGKPIARVREIRDEVRARVASFLAAEGWAR
jgi:paraquat-inducible protein B